MDVNTIVPVLILAAVVIDKILSLLKSRGIDLQRLSRQMDEMHKWHELTDEDGVKVWYFRKSWIESIDKMHEAVNEQSKELEEISRRIDAVESLIRDGGLPVH